MDQEGSPRTRVAVIGSGLAGLTAAHLLSTLPSDIEVHVFEKSQEIGLDRSSITIKGRGDKGSYRIDVPMRSINSGSHGRVKKLYDYLKVPLVKNEFSYSFSRLDSDATEAIKDPVAFSTGTSTRSSTPLPPYSKEPASTTVRRSMPSSAPPSPPPAPFPASPDSKTTLIYEGASGLRWPPAAIPTAMATRSNSLPALVRSTWRQSVYLVHLIFLAISYLHLLVLSFFYVKLGLTQTRTSISLPFFGKVENVGREPLEDWCERHGVLKAMREEVLVPLMAAVCTVGVEEARVMPVGETLEYIASTFMSAHYTTAPAFGVRGIVRRLVAPVQVSNIHLSTQIYRIVSNPDPADRPYTLKYRLESEPPGGRGAAEPDREGGQELDVDYLIFATQANQAASLLETLPPSTDLTKTIDALNSFHYVSTLVVNHTDQSFLPPHPLDRRDLNLAAFSAVKNIADSSDSKSKEIDGVWETHLPSTSVETTHVVSAHPALHSSTSSSCTIPPAPVLQTTNPLRPVDPSRILSSSWFSRAFVTNRSKEILPAFLLGERKIGGGTLQGLRLGGGGGGTSSRSDGGGVYFTGSWCERGIPLLEGCVTSAENVVKDILERESIPIGRTEWPF